MNSLQKILVCEAKSLNRFNLLSNRYKQIGFLLTAASAIVLTLLYTLDTGGSFWRVFTQNVLLLSMLLISISREREEDEYTLSLRMRSYMLGLVCGVLYVVFQPYVIYFITPLLRGGEMKEVIEFPAFPVIWFILFVQIGFYYLLRASR
ncbi:hypothetical protein AB9P05_20615 [Roseivirga sp. BDSF3-8]|uniref:hypothetical protein n=1 Tax=Roseivirga sp. BDSF3-8 TaxID=3241598 RepID=UPI00353198F3